MSHFARAILIGLLLVTGVAAAQEVKPVDKVDLDRYAGKWFEIARFPNKFQADCAGNVTAEYSKRADGELDVINRCRRVDADMDEAVGRATVEDTTTNARLKVRFAPAWLAWLPFVWGDYWVIDLAPDYSLAAVGEPERRFLWILSRTPTVPEETYQALLDRLTAQGFDTTQLRRTKQQ